MNDLPTKKPGFRRAPRLTLEKSVADLLLAVKNIGETPANGDALAQALGHSKRNGSSDAKIGSLTHYGLYESKGGEYRTTELSRRVLYPVDDDDYKNALTEASKTPTLFSELFGTYSGSPIPEQLRNVLVQKFNVNPKGAEDIASCFVENAQFVELLDGRELLSSRGIASVANSSQNELAPELDTKNDTIAAPQQAVSQASGHASNVFGTEYAIPLSGGKSAVLSLPIPVTPDDLKRVRGWIDLMAPVLTEGADENSTTKN